MSSNTAVVTGAHLGGWLCEANTERDESLVLAGDIVDREGRERDPVAHERGLERRHGRVVARLEHELGALRILGRHDRDPRVLSYRDLVLR